MGTKTAVHVLAALTTLLPPPVAAQGRVVPPPDVNDSAQLVIPGPRYRAGPLHRFLLGNGWRDLWILPLEVRPLPIDTFAGGLTPEREGGNKQSITLHFLDEQGKGWVFRSMDKYPAEKLSSELAGTPVGALIQDQIGALHAAGQFVVPPLLDAIGALHVDPVLYVMPDHERLGDYRRTFAGMIGALERKPNEGENDTPGFAGSRKIVDTHDFIDEMHESPVHTIAAGELLKLRLLDFIIGDTDRAADQYRFARFPDPDGYVWRPIPRDRDWVFIRLNGLLPKLFAGNILPKATAYGPGHSSILTYTYSGHVVDRSLLTELDRDAFVRAVAAVQEALTDSVIEQAVVRLPESYPESHARWLVDAMKARRDALDKITARFYAVLASDVDVSGTDAAERVDLVRHRDGRLEVTLSSHRTAVSADFGDATEDNSVYETVVQYHRIFHPSETREVRVYLRAGNDTAVVRGESNAITLRVLGGKGDDLFADSSAAGNLYFYDDEGKSSIASLTATRVDTRPYDAPEPSEGVQFGIDWAPDWGSRRTWGTAVDYGGASGVVLGFGPTFTDYHFRRLPYRWRFDLRALVGIAELQPGLDVKADYRFENSMRSVETRASWPGYDSFHWFGRGNDSERVLTDETPVSFDRLEIASSFKSRFGRWRSDAGNDDEDDAESQDAHKDSRDAMRPMRGSIGIGPVLRYTRTSTSQASSFTKAQPLGFRPLWQTGGRAELDVKWTDGNAVPRRGYRVRAAAEGFPGMLDLPGAYATFTGELDGYVPLVGAIHFALRAGAIRTLGHSVPAFDAAAVGGRRTLRGFSSRRFAGETATYGSAELRVPMGEVPLLVRGELGVFALLDAGRVWDRGESPGGWHSGHGLGLWFAAFDRAISAAYAAGEQTKLYLWLGVPF